jgi:hypothetical protein
VPVPCRVEDRLPPLVVRLGQEVGRRPPLPLGGVLPGLADPSGPSVGQVGPDRVGRPPGQPQCLLAWVAALEEDPEGGGKPGGQGLDVLPSALHVLARRPDDGRLDVEVEVPHGQVRELARPDPRLERDPEGDRPLDPRQCLPVGQLGHYPHEVHHLVDAQRPPFGVVPVDVPRPLQVLHRDRRRVPVLLRPPAERLQLSDVVRRRLGLDRPLLLLAAEPNLDLGRGPGGDEVPEVDEPASLQHGGHPIAAEPAVGVGDPAGLQRLPPSDDRRVPVEDDRQRQVGAAGVRRDQVHRLELGPVVGRDAGEPLAQFGGEGRTVLPGLHQRHHLRGEGVGPLLVAVPHQGLPAAEVVPEPDLQRRRRPARAVPVLVRRPADGIAHVRQPQTETRPRESVPRIRLYISPPTIGKPVYRDYRRKSIRGIGLR